MDRYPRLVGLHGYAGVGKDFAARSISDLYERLAFADQLRDLAFIVNPAVSIGMGADLWTEEFEPLQDVIEEFGWETAKRKFVDVRNLLQRSGDAVRQVFGRDILIDNLLGGLDLESRRYVVSDVRMPREADRIIAAGGVIVRIERPGVQPANLHSTETAMDDYPRLAGVVVNDGSAADLRAGLLEVLGIPGESAR